MAGLMTHPVLVEVNEVPTTYVEPYGGTPLLCQDPQLLVYVLLDPGAIPPSLHCIRLILKHCCRLMKEGSETKALHTADATLCCKQSMANIPDKRILHGACNSFPRCITLTSH